MNYFVIAQETMQITKDRQYEVNGKVVKFPEIDTAEVIPIDPELGEGFVEVKKRAGGAGRIVVTSEDSFEAAARYKNPLVMSFANALHPGGGFKMGANAQEESLCRASTLYESISSDTGRLLYDYNTTHPSKVWSDFMMISPNVCVFRNREGDLLAKPYMVGVITVPAPNRAGPAFRLPKKKTAEAMEQRIRIMLSVAYLNNYRNLVLGAWGCGVFHNEAKDVAEHFRKVLIDEGYAKYFNEICFAIHRKSDRRESRNSRAFRLAFDPGMANAEADSEKKPRKIRLSKVVPGKEAKEKRAAVKAEKKAVKAEKRAVKAEKRAAKAERGMPLRKRRKHSKEEKKETDKM
ncbi:MAG: TIGR02452 family protein [Lachnospiraceae bacterium]|nr:TIGR02452 family protein [Lachnospiraceae bacterium]